MQSFVLVAEIGEDVPESFTCFQREEDEIGCNGNMEPTARFGATKITINDDDGMFYVYCLLNFVILRCLYCSYDHWIFSKEADCTRD